MCDVRGVVYYKHSFSSSASEASCSVSLEQLQRLFSQVRALAGTSNFKTENLECILPLSMFSSSTLMCCISIGAQPVGKKSKGKGDSDALRSGGKTSGVLPLRKMMSLGR